jgi:hypothetical protein
MKLNLTNQPGKPLLLLDHQKGVEEINRYIASKEYAELMVGDINVKERNEQIARFYEAQRRTKQ